MKRIAPVFLMLVFLTGLFAAEKTGPKVFISVDMEGIWGVVHGDQVSAQGHDYGPARKWMAEDVNAVIEGLFSAGASEIVVNDSHGSMRNILAQDLNPRVSLITGSPKPLSMMQGVDNTFDACVFVGYHAKAGTASSILDHTYSGATIRSIKVNNLELPELGLNAAIAGAFGVPVILLSGDGETCNQARSILGSEVVTVAVKESFGRYAAKLHPQEEARKRLREGAKEALLKRSKIAPLRLKPPYAFELEFHNSNQTEMPALVPGVKVTGARSVAFTADDFIEGFKLMRALIALAGYQ
ncbi:MAG: M55 family metallopeptidase [Clostridiales bacterium]|nr:M55 family metallopeptidase [Clostridiales bacterium]